MGGDAAPALFGGMRSVVVLMLAADVWRESDRGISCAARLGAAVRRFNAGMRNPFSPLAT
jgi:hypothetical protein